MRRVDDAAALPGATALARAEAAEAELRQAISDGPDETLPHFLLAVLNDAEGNADAAATGYRAVLAIDAEHEGALSYLGNLLLRQGAYADATRYFDYHHTANDTLDKVEPEALRFNVAAWATFHCFAAETATEFGPLESDEQVRPLPLKSR